LRDYGSSGGEPLPRHHWPIAFTIAYFAVGAAWLALVVTTVSGRLRLIAASFLTVLVLVVGLFSFYLARLT
jgi:hypothetical protein